MFIYRERGCDMPLRGGAPGPARTILARPAGARCVVCIYIYVYMYLYLYPYLYISVYIHYFKIDMCLSIYITIYKGLYRYIHTYM